MKRINAWSSPRNISTALMYSFAQRTDTTVVDEPLYAHYLSKTNTEVEHPGTPEILASQSQDGNQVVEEVILGPYPTPVAFFKQMTHHLIVLDEAFLGQTDHILLIRDPKAIINSYAKVIPNPSHADIGIQKQVELFRKLKKLNRLKAVLDTTQLLLNPSQVLTQLCEQLEIPFDESMLQWEAGPRKEDGVWAPYWYANVHQSTGFQPYQPKTINLPAQLEDLAAECEIYYKELFEEAIKADQ